MRNYLVELRKQKGLTQTQVASSLDIGKSYYHAIESATRQKDMSFSIMERISVAFNVSLDEIIQYEKMFQEKLNSE